MAHLSSGREEEAELPAELHHACRCGKVSIRVDVPAGGAGTRCTCYCKDCQTAARLFGDGTGILAADGGTDIWQTTPDRLTIGRGAEHLTILRLSPKGLYRWHAGCCDTPMFNTLERLALPFVGVVLRPDEAAAATAVLGKSRVAANTASAPRGAGAPRRDRRFGAAARQLVLRMLLALASGRGRRNPLRGADGGPIAPVRVITPEARKTARPPG